MVRYRCVRWSRLSARRLATRSDGAARAFLRVIEREPEAVQRALAD